MILKSRLKHYADRLPYIRTLREELEKFKTPYPPGHYYSPIPSLEDVERRRSKLFDRKDELRGIDLNLDRQAATCGAFSRFWEDVPFWDPSRRVRYQIHNDTFSYDDGPILHYMMRLLEPARVIEIGSGHSSACMLDTDELHLGGQTSFTFIDPFCDNLRTVVKETDYARVTILEEHVQDVDPSLFDALSANDILFVDSSHVAKIGSDVNTIMFEILPRLAAGVHIHFHDVRYPFQYFEPFIQRGYYWNEAYLLRAFLQYNRAFEIVFWLNYLLNAHNDLVQDLLPFLPIDVAEDRYAGGSIWLVRRDE